MTDSTFQEKFNQAWELKKNGDSSGSMVLYSELYEQLIRDAFEHTGSSTGLAIDDKEKVDKYLRGDRLACTILNNMAVILAEAGNKDGAKKYFKASIKLTPEDFNYNDPVIGLKELD